MIRIRMLLAAALAGTGAGAGCGGGERPAPAEPGGPVMHPPVALDPTPAIEFPAGVDDTGAALTVRLRLHVDEEGHVVADSTRIAESSGVPALDSAAVEGAARLRYAPALRDGGAVATSFVQPVEFGRGPR